MTDEGGWRSIPEMVAGAANDHGARLAILDGDRHLTYAELAEQVRAFGASLVAAGTERGERVGIWAPNGFEWVVAALGTLAAGGVVVPVNTRFKGAEAADILARGAVRTLVTTTDFLGVDYLALLDEADGEPPAVRIRVVTSGPVPEGAESWASFTAAATAPAGEEVDRRSADLGPDDPSDLLFTSGTTGAPKGVVQTHGRTLRVATDWVAMTGLTAGDRYLMVNPYFHMFGFKAGILASVAAGATMLPVAVFDVPEVLRRVAQQQVTVLPGPPTLYQSILDCPERADADLSTLRVAVTGAADIPVELIRRVKEELPFSLVVTGYGLTEAGTATATSPTDDAETVATTVGRPRPGFELRVVEATGRDAPPGEAGEIWLRGPSVMSHYLDDAAATAEAFAEGHWLKTGDLGMFREDGCLRIVGRSKDMVIVGGFNVYPAEVENFLLEHPAVGQVAVVGAPDERLGEVTVAFVVRAPGQALDPAELVAWSRGRMANYKVPRAVEVVDSFPLTATGKVQKSELREEAARRRPRAPA
jgi:acyl-CoA synthetase (AMP-forming)/AMP-acid ligase II